MRSAVTTAEQRVGWRAVLEVVQKAVRKVSSWVDSLWAVWKAALRADLRVACSAAPWAVKEADLTAAYLVVL